MNSPCTTVGPPSRTGLPSTRTPFPHPAPRCLQGAQAIEVLPWWHRDKSQLPEWVQAIRDAFGLRIKLYDVQNKETARSMFNQDVSGGLGCGSRLGRGAQVHGRASASARGRRRPRRRSSGTQPDRPPRSPAENARVPGVPAADGGAEDCPAGKGRMPARCAGVARASPRVLLRPCAHDPASGWREGEEGGD